MKKSINQKTEYFEFSIKGVFPIYHLIIGIIIFSLISSSGKSDPESGHESYYDEELPINDPTNFNSYQNPDFYNTLDPNDPRFNWNYANYDLVHWNKVDDFSGVNLGLVHANAWGEIDQSKITGLQVAEIPAEFFDPGKVKLENLKYATKEQITETLGEWSNLRDADPSTVKTVFLEKFNIDLDITAGNKISYDPSSENLIYGDNVRPPLNYPADKFSLRLVGDFLHIIPLKKDGNVDEERNVVVSGKNVELTQEIDGHLIIDGEEATVSGEQNGEIRRSDGQTVDFFNGPEGVLAVNPDGSMDGKDTTLEIGDGERKQIVQGTEFRVDGTTVVLVRDSILENLENLESSENLGSLNEEELIVRNENDPLVVLPLDDVPAAGYENAQNIVRYADSRIEAQGIFQLQQGELEASSDDSVGLVSQDLSSLSASGQVDINTRNYAYEGSPSSLMNLENDDKEDILTVDVKTEGEEVQIIKKITLVNPAASVDGSYAQEQGLKVFVARKNGKLEMSLEQENLNTIAQAYASPTTFLLPEQRTKIELADGSASLRIDEEGGAFFTADGMGTVELLAPRLTEEYLGEDVSEIKYALEQLATGNPQQIEEGRQVLEDIELDPNSFGQKSGIQASLLLSAFHNSRGDGLEARKHLELLISSASNSEEAWRARDLLQRVDSLGMIEAALSSTSLTIEQMQEWFGAKGLANEKTVRELTRKMQRGSAGEQIAIPGELFSGALSTFDLRNLVYLMASASGEELAGDRRIHQQMLTKSGLSYVAKIIQSGRASDVATAIDILRNGDLTGTGIEIPDDLFTSLPLDPHNRLMPMREALAKLVEEEPLIMATKRIQEPQLFADSEDKSLLTLQKEMLKTAQKYRSKENYRAAAALTQSLTSSPFPEVAEEARRLYSDISGDDWLDLADETIQYGLIDMAISFANPAMLAGYSGAVGGLDAVLSTSKTVQTVRTVLTKVGDKVLGTGPASQLFKEVLKEGIEEAAGFACQGGPCDILMAAALGNAPHTTLDAPKSHSPPVPVSTLNVPAPLIYQHPFWGEMTVDVVSPEKFAELTGIPADTIPVGPGILVENNGIDVLVVPEGTDLSGPDFIDLSQVQEDLTTIGEEVDFATKKEQIDATGIPGDEQVLDDELFELDDLDTFRNAEETTPPSRQKRELTLGEERFTFNPESGSWYREGVVNPDMVSSDLAPDLATPTSEVVTEIETLVQLETRRLEDIPPPLVESALRNSLSSITTVIEGGPEVVWDFRREIHPRDYEQQLISLTREAADSSLTKDEIKELVLLRAQSEGLSATELKNLRDNFDKLYGSSVDLVKALPKFSRLLSELDPSYLNVHLFRDGALLGTSDSLYRQQMGLDDSVRMIFVSRATTNQQSDKLRWMANAIKADSLPEFRQTFQEKFNQLMETDHEFRKEAERTYAYLKSEDLLGNKLRFVDTCCTGTINLFLEGTIRYYHSDAELQSVLMYSDITGLGKLSHSEGYSLEGAVKGVEFGGVDDDGIPSMKPTEMESKYEEEHRVVTNHYGPKAGSVLSYLEQLVTLQQTKEFAQSDPRAGAASIEAKLEYDITQRKETGKVSFEPTLISEIPPEMAAFGLENPKDFDGQSMSENVLQHIKSTWQKKNNAGGDKVISTHPLEIFEASTGYKLIVKGGPTHTTRAYYIGQRLLTLAGLPTPRTNLVAEGDNLVQVMEFKENTHSSQTMPAEFHQSRDVQLGFAMDALIGNYDRADWNMLYGSDGGVFFIDQGAALGSRAQGGFNGFSQTVSVKDVQQILTNPQFGGNVNPAYANLLEVQNGEIIVHNKEVMKESIERLNAITNEQITAIVDNAYSVGQVPTVEELSQRRAALQKDTNPKSQAAAETIGDIIYVYGGNEAAYYRDALIKRRDSLVKLLSKAQKETEIEFDLVSAPEMGMAVSP
ncbi:hypothetical protein J4437_02110 [Candidatus Woesearchaeota archaeon]|nr:hypothetical protein [Candidatus Woesearchaeota archaeon]